MRKEAGEEEKSSRRKKKKKKRESVCYSVKQMVGQAITDRTGGIHGGNEGFLVLGFWTFPFFTLIILFFLLDSTLCVNLLQDILPFFRNNRPSILIRWMSRRMCIVGINDRYTYHTVPGSSISPLTEDSRLTHCYIRCMVSTQPGPPPQPS